MKIAMLGHKRLPSREGGVEVVVEELSTRMAALGHDVTVYSRRGHSVVGAEYDNVNANNTTEYKGVHVKTVNTLDIKGLAAASSSYYAMKSAIADKPDVIHIHAEGPAAVCGMAKRAGIPCVVTIHGLDWQRAKWGVVGKRYILHGEREAAKKADSIIVLSQSAKEYFRTTYNRDVLLIPNGIEAKQPLATEIIANKYGLAENGYILYVGRMVPEKGVHYLIDAFTKLQDCDRSCGKKLVLAGGSSDSHDYYRQLKESCKHNPDVLFTGFTLGDELNELFSNAYVFVLPSDIEGMPMSLLEAMAFRNCCLVSDISENSNVISSHGVVFEHGSVESLVDRLGELLRNSKEVSRYSQEALPYITETFSWEKTCMETLRLYQDMLNRHSRR